MAGLPNLCPFPALGTRLPPPQIKYLIMYTLAVILPIFYLCIQQLFFFVLKISEPLSFK